LATRQEFAPWLRKFHRDRKQIRLSQAALEVLSIVAFKQPITRVELDAVRGVSSTGVLQTLMELTMIRIVGRSDGVGKPMLFGSTKEFLIHFGLKTLADLPKPKELEELLAEEGRKVQSQLGLGFDEEAVEDESEESAEQGDQVEEQDEVEKLQRADDSDAPNENGIAPEDDEQSEEENDA
jgi:segregation and condensation protein B